MNSKLVQYLSQCLRGSGFAVLDADIAFPIARDLWATAFNAASDLADSGREAFAADAGARLFHVRIKGRPDPLKVLARSGKDLGDRIECTLGLLVEETIGVRTFAPPPTGGKPVASYVPPEVPAHACVARAAYFEARGERDPMTARERGTA